MYISFEEYSQFHTDVTEAEFNKFCLMAQRIVDKVTTGIDGVRKLELYFPTDGDAEYVRLCVAELIHDLKTYDGLDRNLSLHAEGAGRAIASISSGSESISYSQAQTQFTLYGNDRDKYLMAKATSYLRGLYDANGVSLLYMGEYYV